MAERYEPGRFESKWRKRWAEADLFRTREEPGRPKFYGLDFFPYPSGAGLSVGHCRNYVPTDVICRAKYMQGYNVLHPMGFDAFGLPAENEAIARKIRPESMVQSYGENYRRQMDLVGIGYDWSRSFYSSDPDYYRWTQWIFELLYKRGLAYRKLAEVNWCPKDKTALANEEVVGGLCERCGTPVERKQIPQWFFKISEYAQRLLDDLETLDWPDGIKEMQRNWIGRSEGVQFSMKVDLPPVPRAREGPPDPGAFEVVAKEREMRFDVFTTRIDTVFGATFCVLAPEHPLVEDLIQLSDPERAIAVRAYVEAARSLSEVDRIATTHAKSGVFSGHCAINPANGERIPIWIADYVLASYGTGAIMAVPGHDERDFEFATQFELKVVPVIGPQDGAPVDLPWTDKQGAVLLNSGEYDGMPVHEAQAKLGEWMEALGIGRRLVTYRLRDWLISRQRYWGCPIPIVYDPDGGEGLVEVDSLPVLLPDVENYEPTGDGRSPLASIPDFVNAASRDGRLGQRETDTMGGFACSSWYFLRFCDPQNPGAAWSLDKAKYWMPVDCYVGGAEHAVMHLLYARFWTKVLFDAGLCPVEEPFERLVNQGQVLALTPYRKAREGETLGVGEDGVLVGFDEAKQLPDADLMWRWARMSKSKGNVVTPDEMVSQFGADALRVHELFVAPFDADVQWSNEGVASAAKFLNRVFRMVEDLRPYFDPRWREAISEASDDWSSELRRATHRTIAKATDDIDRFAFNTYISALMIHLNSIADSSRTAGLSANSMNGEARARRAALSEAMQTFLLLLAPAAPFCADELWESLGLEGFTYRQPWPKSSAKLAESAVVTIVVQVNGKLRDTLHLPAGSAREDLEAAALASPKVRAIVDGKDVRKVIVVQDKLVNVVVG